VLGEKGIENLVKNTPKQNQSKHAAEEKSQEIKPPCFAATFLRAVVVGEVILEVKIHVK